MLLLIFDRPQLFISCAHIVCNIKVHILPYLTKIFLLQQISYVLSPSFAYPSFYLSSTTIQYGLGLKINQSYPR